VIEFIEKEFKEQIKTQKLFLVTFVFIFFAVLSPILTKNLQEIVKASIDIELPPPLPVDSYLQFFKSVYQLGLLIFILFFMGCVALEKERGTAAMILSKPVSRLEFILSKYIAVSAAAVFALFIGSILCYAYTGTLFEESGDFLPFAKAMGCYAVFFLGSSAVIVLFSTLLKNQLFAGAASAVVLIVMSFTSQLDVGKYFFSSFLELATTYLQGGSGEITTPLVSAVVLIGLCLVISWQVFEYQEI
jgi:ABC-2 type transport system permease protein